MFVTVVAWIFIAISGFGILILTLQSAMFYFMFRDALMHKPMEMKGAPEWLGYFLQHPWILIVASWLVTLLTLAAAIGLLRRANWARIVFIGILGIGIAWNLGGIVVQGFVFSTFPDLPPQTPPEFAAGFKAISMAITIGSALFAIVLSIVFGWIIKRLLSQSARTEFQPSRGGVRLLHGVDPT